MKCGKSTLGDRSVAYQSIRPIINKFENCTWSLRVLESGKVFYVNYQPLV